MEDAAIVELYWQRAPEAIGHTQEKYGAYCLAIAGRLVPVREDAEECVNDTWLRAWNAMPTARPCFLAPFLGRITRNLALDKAAFESAQKRGGGAAQVLLSELEECGAQPAAPGCVEDELDAKELAGLIERFLSAQKATARRLFLMRYFLCMPVREAAGRLGITEAKARTLLCRTRRRLRAYLQQQGVEV